MSDENKKAFEIFDDRLEVQRCGARADDGIDIRERVLAIRHREVLVGYIRQTLSNSYAANLPRLFTNIIPIDEYPKKRPDISLLLGTIYPEPTKSHKGGVRLLQNLAPSDHLMFFEQGFLSSSHSWSESFRQKNPVAGCLGYVYDDIAHYFMADYPNRLIHKLNSDAEPSAEELSRAKAAIDRIVERKISKYNSQPIISPSFAPEYPRRVLVCDQAFADASTIYGKVDEQSFENMILAAIAENPDAEILVKTHPDTFWEKGKRTGYYSHLQSSGRVRILRDPINPFSLFEIVDTVYVGTSQLGLEALFAGKKVVCFGAPFYSGWGLTDDRQPVSHRYRTRSLEEIFHYFYIWYTIYHVPGCPVPSQIEDAINFIEVNRPVALPPSDGELAAAPKISVILPVYGVEKFIEQCLNSILSQSLREIEIITVNDCSPDRSQEIIDRLAAEDNRIRPIVLKENVGQGFARNIGIEAARGEYIQFLDSDDFMASPDHLRTVYERAERDCADMVRGRKLFERIEDKNGKFIKRRRDNTETFFDQEFSHGTLKTHPEIMQSRHFWNWLYRRDLLNENSIRFVTTQWEERPFLLKALLLARSISTVNSEGFVYRVRQDSTARREKNAADYENQLANFASVLDLLRDHGAFKRDGALWNHGCFQVSQYLQYLFNGHAYRLVRDRKVQDDEATFIARIKNMIEPTGIGPQDLLTDPIQLSRQHVEANAFPLLLAAVYAEDAEYVRMAVDLVPIEQAELHQQFAREPQTRVEADFQWALNRYARNNGVAPAQPSSSEESGRKIRVIIHIGSTKTGSTYLQHFFEDNRPAMLRQGIWFPEVGLFWQKGRPHKQAGHSMIGNAAVRGDDTIKDYIEAGLEMAESRIHTVILSSEAFFLNPKTIALVDYFAGNDVEMVCYLRRQDDWANSQYAEFVAGGAVGKVSVPIEDWLKDDLTRSRLDYFATLEHWATKIGRENIHARIFDRSKMRGGDILTDFCHVIGHDELLDLPKPAQSRNNQFPLETGHIHAIRHFNQLPWTRNEDYLQFIENVTNAIKRKRSNEGRTIARPELLTTEERRSILATYDQSNQNLGAAYFNLPIGQPVFDDLMKDASLGARAELDLDEFDLIASAYEAFRPVSVQTTPDRSNTGKKAAEGQVIVPSTMHREDFSRSVTYRAFIKTSTRIMSSRMQRKLRLKPDLFFNDAKNPFSRFIGRLIELEMRSRT